VQSNQNGDYDDLSPTDPEESSGRLLISEFATDHPASPNSMSQDRTGRYRILDLEQWENEGGSLCTTSQPISAMRDAQESKDEFNQ
jgi:hypothetical protein